MLGISEEGGLNGGVATTDGRMQAGMGQKIAVDVNA